MNVPLKKKKNKPEFGRNLQCTWMRIPEQQMTVFILTAYYSPLRGTMPWKKKTECKLHLVLHISCLLNCTWPVLFQAVRGEISSCSFQKIADMNLLVSPTDRN